MSLPVYTAAGDGTNTQGELLNQAHATANTPGNFWPMGAAGQGSGARTFFVQGTKNATAPSGVGCKTGIVQVVIQDQHLTPDITLTPFFDSFCIADAGNNLIGDGRITVVADVDAATPGQQVGNFNYSWSPVPVASSAPPVNSNAASFDITQLHDGTYTVTVTNNATFCSVQNSTVINPAPYVLAINNALVTDQRVCNNDGRIEVTQITLTDNSVGSPASTTDNTPALIDARYSFQWYNNAALTPGTELEDAIAPDDITHKVLGHDANGDFVPGEDDYGLMQAGTYYVVATRTNNLLPGFGCPTLPFRVDVQDVHKNPIPNLTVLSNTSCIPAGPGEGEIHINVSDATGGPFLPGGGFTYTYTWTGPTLPGAPNAVPGNGNGNGDSSDGDDDQYLQLLDNATPYNVRITNDQTGCFNNAIATIVKNATPVFVQNVTVADEILCGPAGDGSITVTRVTLNDRNGNEEEFVPAPGVGQGNITDFNFEWRRTGNPFVQTTTGNLLDNGTYDATPAGFNTPIGAGTYTVTARRATGTPGAGCPSAPFQVVIQDKRINPVVSLTPFANTSCAALATDMEGEIRVKVTDATTAPGVTGFTYNWTTTPALTPIGAGAGDGDADGGDGDDDHPTGLADGDYSVTVTSNKSGCQGIGTTTILKNTTPIFIQDVAVLNQILCGPDGQLTVASVTLNDRDGNTQTFNTGSTPNISDFEFTWTRPGIAGSQVTMGTVLNPTNYVAANFANTPFGFGNYTVTARRNAGGPGNGCSSAPYTVAVLDRRIFPVVTLTPFANTSCSLDPLEFEGEIEITVGDASPAVGPAGFDYTWNAGTGTALVSNNPANDGDGNGGDGDDDNPTALREGTYSITVTSNKSGCPSTAQTEIFKNSTPVFTQLVTPTDQVLCSADGRLVVNEVRVIDRDQNTQSSLTDFPITDFEFTYSRTTIANTIPGVTGTQLNVGNFPTIGADTYFVVARRVAGGPGLDCVSPPYKVDIQDKALFPVVSLTPFANTSCDPTFFEGEIEVRVTDNSVNLPAPLAGAPFSYAYNWTTSATPAVINGPVAGTHDGDGSGADGDADHPITLEDGDYVIEVRNTQTNCISTGSTTIFKNSTPVFTQLVTPVHQILCNPDGSLTVNEVKVIDRDGNVESNLTGDFPLSDFEFSYDRTTIGNTIPGVTTTTLTSANYPTIGFDSYFVVATRVAGGPGLNCSSAPYKVDIEDRRVYPTVSFTSLANSSCNVLMPNGSVTANAAEPNGTNTGPYTFGWTLNGGAISPASTINNTANSSVVSDALDGNYIVTATNTITGCPFDASFALKLDQTMSTPNIIEVLTTDPLDCNPSASAEVTKITLGSTSNSVLFPPNIPPNNEVTGADLLNFTYNWYKGGIAPSDQLAFTTPCIGPGCATPTGGVTAGTYFVTVLDPRTDCVSGPKEVVINDDDIVYPQLVITQTRLQVSCIGGVGSAELQATADGFSDTNNNYLFTWFRNLDATPPIAQTGSTFSNLVAGDYSAEVLDQTTGCISETLYIVPDDTPRFLPEVSLSTDPRVNCLVNDGVLLAREIGFNPNSGYPFPSNYSAELYVGPNANVSVPGTVMLNEPGFPRNWRSTGLDIGPYTVKIIDNNTGCTTTGEITVNDGRTAPVVIILQENPLVNCDPARPNGQLAATADGGRIGGYGFEWYGGASATGATLGTNNVLSGLALGSYTVRVTNDLTGCFDDEVGNITDGRLKAPEPDAEVKAHRTHCIFPDGWVSASVKGVTIAYEFEWFDGQSDAGTADFIGPDYTKRPEGFYTVKVMDRVTGCYSDPVSVEVLDQTELPELVFTTTPSFCEDLPDGFAKGNGTAQVELKPENLLSDSIVWSKIEEPTEPLDQLSKDEVVITTPGVGMAAYVTDLYPGFYIAEVETIKGCRNWGVAEVKTEIRAYNLVTRNSDGKNDAFVIDCISRFPNNNVKIFNRAGVKVYEADGYDNNEKVFRGFGERGVYTTGNDLPVGTYFYIIDKRDGSKPRTGYLELVK
ncbi:MAG TPA: gliding motility-associated C-terminal domain-containing protein [Chryseosolibacter sp.]